MSDTIDRKVVEMQFDNRQFESNVSTTMSTLDKLKKSLHLDGASKGLENVNKAAKDVDMRSLEKSVENVKVKFSALDVIGVTALSNITNSAVNAGKRILKALTIDPVKTGFSEYELKMDSVKTIVASTGESLERVNELLEELNTYSDQTIYSFSDMTKNIGKFTNAGVKLEDAVLAIKGISNEAAVSGANAEEASRAMYNFAQALSAGYVKLIDWKSIENANMATVEFKQQLLDTAVEIGTVTKSADGMYRVKGGKEQFNATKNFNETLQDQWMTTEVLIETLRDYADVETDIGKKAFAAAQDVTKLSQVFDIAKEVAQSGWAKTWELIFGDLEQAKKFFTPLSEAITKVQMVFIKFRNGVLESALGRKFTYIADAINGIVNPIEKAVDGVSSVTSALLDYDEVVNQIIRGEWGNYHERWDALAAAGYDWAHAQNLVNERLGVSLRRATNYTETQEELVETQTKLNKSQTEQIEQLIALSDAELAALGYTEDQIAALRELARVADKLGLSISDFLDNIDNIDGRWLLMESLKNMGSAILGVFKAMGSAFTEIFDMFNQENVGNVLFDIIAALHRFTKALRLTDEMGELNENGMKIQRTFKGIFAILDIVTTVIMGPFKIAFKAINKILDAFGYNIFDITAMIGDMAVKVRDIFHLLFDGVIDIGINIAEGIVNGLGAGLKSVIGFVYNFAKSIIETMCEVLGIHSPSREGFKIGWNFLVGVWNGMKALVGKVISYVKSFGSGIGAGLLSALKIAGTTIFSFLKSSFGAIVNFIKNIDIGKVVSIAVSSALTVVLIKMASAIDAITSPLEGLGDLLYYTGKSIRDFGKGMKSYLKGVGFKETGKGVMYFAAAIGILAASVWLLASVGTNNVDGLKRAVIVVAVLAGVIALLAFALSKISIAGAETKIALGKLNYTHQSFAKMAILLVGIGAAVLLMASAIKKLEFLDKDNIKHVLIGFTALILGFLGLLYMLSLLTKNPATSKDLGKATVLLIGTAIAVKLMVGVIKKIDKLEDKAIIKGISVIAVFGIFIAAFAKVLNRYSGASFADVGKTLLLTAVALLILVRVMKIVNELGFLPFVNGCVAIAAFAVLIKMLVWSVGATPDTKIAKVGKTILAISAALILMAYTVKILSSVKWADLWLKGFPMMAAFAVFIIAFISVLKVAPGQEVARMSITLVALAAAVGILALVCTAISLLSPTALVKGLAAIVVLGAVMTAMIWATRGASKCVGNLVVMAVAIGVMAAAAAALTLIDPKELIVSSTAMVGMMSAFAIMIYSVSKLGPSVNKALPTILVMTLIVGSMAGLLYLMGEHMNSDMAIKNAIAIGVLLVSLSASLLLVNSVAVGLTWKSIFMTIVAMLGLIPTIAAIAFILASMSETKNAISNALALAGLMTALTVLLIPLLIIGAIMVGTSGIGAIAMLAGLAALVAMCAPMAMIARALRKMSDTENATENAEAIAKLLTIMTDVLVKLSLLGPLAIIGLAAITVLTIVMGAIGGLAVCIGALFDKIPILKKFLDTGLSVLEKLAGSLGKMIGMFIGGIAQGVTASLPQVGSNLSDFMESIQPFIEGAKLIDPSSLDGVKSLVGIISALTATNIVDGLTSWFTGGNALTKFGAEIAAFGPHLKSYADSVSGINPNAVKASAEAAKSLAEISSYIPNSGGVASWFAGDNSISKFSDELPKLGKGLKGFSDSIDGITPENVTAATEAAKGLAEMADVIPNEGGVASWFAGDNSITKFSDELPKLGSGLKGFSDSIDGINPENVTAAANAAKALGEMTSVIPNEGGVASWFAGDNSISKFSSELSTLGTDLKGFSDSIDGINPENVTAAANAAKSLGEMTSVIPNEGGVASWFAGENSISKFSDELPKLGSGLKGFSDSIDGINPENVTSAANAAKALGEMTSVIPKEGGIKAWFCGDTNLTKFSGELPKLGSGLKGFSDSIDGIVPENVTAAANAAKALGEMTEVIPDNLDSISDFGSELEVFGTSLNTYFEETGDIEESSLNNSLVMTDAIKNFVTSFDSNKVTSASEAIIALTDALKGVSLFDDTSVDNFNSAISEFGSISVDALVSTFNDSHDSVKEACVSLVTACSDSIGGQAELFTTAGGYLVDGFVTGINTNTYKAEAEAKAMAEAAYTAATTSLDINSPSKKFMTVGASVVEGFGKGVRDNYGNASEAGATLGTTILNATKDTLDINSPSVVFNKEVGRYVVQGVAEGIKEDMSAEEAAKQKASNIVEAFRKYLDKHDLASQIAQKELELWRLKSGNKATALEKNAKEIEYLQKDLDAKLSKQTLAYSEWQETIKHMGQNSDEAKEAYSKYLDTQTEVLAAENELAEAQNYESEKRNRDLEKGMEVRAKRQELWEATIAQNLSDAEKDKRYIRDLNDDITSLSTQLAIANKEHSETLKKYNSDSEEVLEAWTKAQDIQIEIAEKKNEITRIEKEGLERERSLLKEKQQILSENATLDYQIWELTDGKKASDSEKIDAKRSTLTEQLETEVATLNVLYDEYQTLLKDKKYGKDHNDTKAKLNEYKQQRIEILQMENDIAQLEVEAMRREQERYSLSSEMADLEYQIWEKTSGKKATASEKNVKKLSVLSEQLKYQSEILQLTYEEYETIAEEYGSRSLEAQSKYKEYMQQQLEIANIQNDITDIQKTAVERQKLAKSDYEEYIENYAKFYELNGMTREQLEKDAKLTSGYDPNDAVSNMVDKTNEELNGLLNNDSYSRNLSGFREMGSSYVKAVNEGIETNSKSFTDTTAGMVNGCVTFIEGTQEAWSEIGKIFMEALSNGIKNGSSIVFNVVAGVGDTAVEKLKSAMEQISEAVNSSIDTEPTIKPVLDLSNVESGSAKLATMISRNHALSISDSMNDSGSEGQNGTSGSSGGATYNFTQNNYSPKALSSTDIYRQTKNQFATLKKVTR